MDHHLACRTTKDIVVLGAYSETQLNLENMQYQEDRKIPKVLIRRFPRATEGQGWSNGDGGE